MKAACPPQSHRNRRGKRRRIATGIYADRIGLSAVVSVGDWRKEKRFPKHTPLSEIKDWQAAWRLRYRSCGLATVPRGTFAADVDRYLALVKHLAGWIELRAELRAWVARIGTLRRTQLTEDKVLQARVAWLQVGLRPKTVNNRVAALSRLWHRLDGRRAPCPTDNIRPLPVHKTPIQRIHDASVLIVYETLRGWEDSGQLHNSKARGRFMVYASTGRRPSEIMRAQPGDVDLERRIWIPRDGKGGWGPGIYLNDDMLYAWEVFIKADAWGPFSGNSFVRLLRKAGWPAHIRPYHLRHTVGIALSEAGADLADVQQHMGHSRIDTTRKHYVPVLGSRLQQASESLNGRFGWSQEDALPRGEPRNTATGRSNLLQTKHGRLVSTPQAK